MSRAGVCLLGVLGALWAGGWALAATAGAGGWARAASAGVGSGHRATAARADRITIDSPDGAKARKAYNITIHGFAHRRARAVLFVDYLGCAKSFAVEHQRARRASYSYRVKGGFTEVSGWQSSTAGVDHACAYLIGYPSGDVLATARTAFQVARRGR